MSSPYLTRTATVFLVFNRPDVTARVFEKIREARPPKLLVVCDGPRPSRAGEAERVKAVRDIIDLGVDWPCEVFRNYADTNMGCRHRVASGLNWAFSLVEEAIILEDDCLPDNSFFWYCDEMLERYRDDAEVMHISGCNLAARELRASSSYRFSRHPWVWGWATWQRAWKHYDFTMSSWEDRHQSFKSSFASKWDWAYWHFTFRTCKKDLETANTWAYPWNYTCRSLGGLSLLPSVNLIENLGFGENSTHTSSELQRLPLRTEALEKPLEHPKSKIIDRYADELFTRIYDGAPISYSENLKSRVRTWRKI